MMEEREGRAGDSNSGCISYVYRRLPDSSLDCKIGAA